jgi:Beta-lactamase
MERDRAAMTNLAGKIDRSVSFCMWVLIYHERRSRVPAPFVNPGNHMKIKSISCGLFLLGLFWVAGSGGLSQSVMIHAQSLNGLPNSSLDQRISRIENGLSVSIGKGDVVSSKFKLTDRMKFYKTPGVSVAVINNGTIEWARGYGVRAVESTDPVSPETLFQAASISKPVAAMAALKLVQDGRLNLDDDVNQKLVSWKVPDHRFTKDHRVTLRNILSHSAGLNVHGFGGYGAGESLPTLPQILNGTKPANSGAIKVKYRLNRKFRYSGGGYVIMQQLLSDVTGQPFPELRHNWECDKALTSSPCRNPSAS